MNVRQSDLADFLAELRRVRRPTEGQQADWERQIISFENCLSIVDRGNLDFMQAITSCKNQPVERRLHARFVALDRIKKLSDKKARSVQAETAKRDK